MESYIPMHDALLQKALEIYSAPEPNSPIAFADALMDTESLAMHCPEHHFIVPAALLLAAHRKDGHDIAVLEKDLKTALMRAKSVPGGFCGNCGCCGAAIGTGIFAAVWLGTNPKSTENWALVNRMTAAALSSVATVEGPRCCKRVTYLALTAASEFFAKELSLNFGDTPAITCHHFAHNTECRGKACPYFPAK
jgi:hypothetical protein